MLGRGGPRRPHRRVRVRIAAQGASRLPLGGRLLSLRRPRRDRAWYRALAYSTLLPLLREHGYRRAHAGIALPNRGSVRLHEAMDFLPVGVYEKVGFKFGHWHDVGWWQLQLVSV